MKKLALYIHIPFCVRKCLYCDFLSFPMDEKREFLTEYPKLLREEMEDWRGLFNDYIVESIFFGGGTPTVMSTAQLADIFASIREYFSLADGAEITMEANPGTLTAKKTEALRKMGVNRLSIGLQAVGEKELRCLGRIHSYADFLESFANARAYGFDNINVDLMSAIPGQSVRAWEECLRSVARLSPEHISAYSLIIEEGTYFYTLYREGGERGAYPQLPEEEEERQMYHATADILAEYGYERYEISNYARKGKECRHNLTYWRRGDYLGIGLGASSCIGNQRFKNTADPVLYRKGERISEREELEHEEERFEAMMLGLRLTEGVRTAEFAARYGILPEERYGEWIGKMIQEGLLEKRDGTIRLTGRGLDLADYVIMGFMD